jgi:hypothetical protein
VEPEAPAPAPATAAVPPVEVARDWEGMVRRLDQQSRNALNTKRQVDEMAAEVARITHAMDAMVEAMDTQMALRMRRLENVEAEAQALRRRVATLEAECASEPGADLSARIQACENDVLEGQEEVASLGLQLCNFKERIDSGGLIECNGLRFPSMREALDWYSAKAVATPGLFVDALALLHGLSAAYVSMADSGKRRETQGKNNFANDVEEFVIQSFDTTIPGSFVGGKKDVDGASAHAVLKSVLKTFQIWKPRGDMVPGVASQIIDGVRNKRGQLLAFFQEHTGDADVKMLVQGLLSDSAYFCQEFVSFINTQNDSLTHDTTYSPEQIWDMQLECIRTIFQELAEARSEFMLLAQSVPAYYLWGMLKAWGIQQRYLKNHFKDDPALMGVFLRRVVLQAGNDGLKDKLVKLDKLQDQVADHNRIHTQAINQLKAAVAKNKP